MRSKLFALVAFATLLIAAGTSDNTWIIGDGNDTDKFVRANVGDGANNPYLFYDSVANAWRKSDDGTTITDFGGGAGIETTAKSSFIPDGDFEQASSLSGWNYYDSTAGVLPTFSEITASASGLVTITRNTTTPISGSADLNVTYEIGSNRQGIFRTITTGLSVHNNFTLTFDFTTNRNIELDVLVFETGTEQLLFSSRRDGPSMNNAADVNGPFTLTKRQYKANIKASSGSRDLLVVIHRGFLSTNPSSFRIDNISLTADGVYEPDSYPRRNYVPNPSFEKGIGNVMGFDNDSTTFLETRAGSAFSERVATNDATTGDPAPISGTTSLSFYSPGGGTIPNNSYVVIQTYPITKEDQNKLLEFSFKYRLAQTALPALTEGEVLVYVEYETLAGVKSLLPLNSSNVVPLPLNSSGDTETLLYRSAFVPGGDGAHRVIIFFNDAQGSEPINHFLVDDVYVGPGNPPSGFDGIWKTFENGTDYTLTSDAAGPVTFVSGNLRPEKDAAGNWTISGQIAFNHAADTSFVVTVPGVVFKDVTDFRQAITVQEASASRARTIPNTSNIEVTYAAAASFSSLSLSDVEIEGQPTWSDFDPPNNYLNDNVTQANVYTEVSLSSSPSVNTNDPIPYDNVDTFNGQDMWSGAPNYEMTVPADGTYEYSVNFRTGDGNSIAIVQVDTGSGFVNDKRSIFGINASANLTSNLQLSAGDKVRVVHVTGVARQYTADYNSFTLRRVQEFSAGQSIGFGLAGNDQYGLVSSEVPTTDITGDCSISAGTNVTAAGTLGLVSYSRVGQTVTVSFNITGTTLTAADTLSDIVLTLPTFLGRTTATQRTAIGSYWQSTIQPRVRFGPVIANTGVGTNSWIIRGTSDSGTVQSVTGTFTYNLDW